MLSDWFWKKINILCSFASIGFIFFLGIFMANIEIKDQDLWLHLASGKYILEHFSIPLVDIFSNSIHGQPWINHEWLFQVILAVIDGISGVSGLINLQVFLVVTTMGIMLLLVYDQNKLPWINFLLLSFLFVYKLRFTIRPDLFSILFVVLYFFIISRYLHEKKVIFFLFFLQVLWSNIHGFFILGPLIVFVMFLSDWIKRVLPLPFEWNRKGRFDGQEYNHLAWTLGAVILACLVNPHFIKGAVYPLTVLLSSSGDSLVFFEYIQELRKPLQWKSLFNINQYFFFKMLIVISFLSFCFNLKKIELSSLFLWIIFLFLSLSAVRNLPYFAVIAFFVIISNSANFSLEKFFSNELSSSTMKNIWGVIGSLLLICLMLKTTKHLSIKGYFDYDKNEWKSEYGGISKRNYPHKAVDFLRDNKVTGNFYNDFNSGAYLIGRVFPNIKVFIDGRTEVYGAQYFKNYKKILAGDKVLFDRAVEQYNLTGVLLGSIYFPASQKTVRNLYTDKDWVLVYFDYDAVIFLKNIEKNQKWISQYSIDLSQWNGPEADLDGYGMRNINSYQFLNRAHVLMGVRQFDQAEHQVNQAVIMSPPQLKTYKILGKLNLEKNDVDQAFQNFRKAKILAAGDIESRYYLAMTLYFREKYEDAQKQGEIVVLRKPKKSRGLFLLSLIYDKQGKKKLAQKMFERSMNEESYEIEDLENMARILKSLNDVDREQEVLEFLKEIKKINDLRKGLNE